MAINSGEGDIVHVVNLADDVPDMSQMDYDLEYSVRVGKQE